MRALAIVIAFAGCATEPPDRWSYLYATIFEPSCTTSACHSTLSARGSLALDDPDAAFATLTGRACGDAAPAAGYVNTDDPRASLLSVVLRREGPTGMPPNRPLASYEIELIESWMRRGAPCD